MTEAELKRTRPKHPPASFAFSYRMELSAKTTKWWWTASEQRLRAPSFMDYLKTRTALVARAGPWKPLAEANARDDAASRWDARRVRKKATA
jgi:hypothetical protein